MDKEINLLLLFIPDINEKNVSNDFISKLRLSCYFCHLHLCLVTKFRTLNIEVSYNVENITLKCTVSQYGLYQEGILEI